MDTGNVEGQFFTTLSWNQTIPGALSRCNTNLSPKHNTMKPSTVSAFLMVFATAIANAFVAEDTLFTVTIQGVENRDVLKDGVKPFEMTQVTVDVRDKNFKIHEFEIILARGKSAVGFPATVVTGNQYDLVKFRGIAKPGDRIVIKVNKTIGSNGERIHLSDGILQIPIK